MSTQLFIAGAFVLMILISVTVLRRARSTLSADQKTLLQKQWKHVESLSDPARVVLEAEKVLDHAFTLRGYTGTFADKLRRAERLLPHYQQLWDAHKLRNRIAHEPGITVTPKQAERAAKQFRKALDLL